MRAIRIIEYKPSDRLFEKRVIALGLFDGVHIGHREIIKRAVCEAKRLSLPTAVFTFKQSSRLKNGTRIYSDEEKINLIAECGVDEILLAQFEDFCTQSASDFIKKTLVQNLNCAVAVTGADFRFGYGALGCAGMLSEIMRELERDVITVEDVMAHGVKISSTDIKKHLSLGNVKLAAELLGKPYYVRASAERGMGLGKSFGFPTLNTDISDWEISLPRGVYATVCEIDGKEYNSLTNVGNCPTVSDRPTHRETFILGFNREIYGERVKISFVDYIRDEKKFSSVDELKMQIKVDIEKTFGAKEGE